MGKYIDAEQIAETYLQRARSEWRKMKEGNAGNAFAEASYIALHYPAADVQEVRHGRWATNDIGMFECTVCKTMEFSKRTLWRYCPYCGAKVDEVEE